LFCSLFHYPFVPIAITLRMSFSSRRSQFNMGVSPSSTTSSFSSSSSRRTTAPERYVSYHHRLLPLLLDGCPELPREIISMIMEYAYIPTLILFGVGADDPCLMWQPHIHRWLPFFDMTSPVDGPRRIDDTILIIYQNHLMMLGEYGNWTLDLSVITSTSTPLPSLDIVSTSHIYRSLPYKWQSMSPPRTAINRYTYIIKFDRAVILGGNIYAISQHDGLVSRNASPSSINDNWKLLEKPLIQGRWGSTLIAVDSYTNLLTGKHVDGYLLRTGGRVGDVDQLPASFVRRGRAPVELLHQPPTEVRRRLPTERYDPITNTWSFIDEFLYMIPYGLITPYVFVIPGHSIIIVGGVLQNQYGTRAYDEVLQWDLRQSKWLPNRPNWKITARSPDNYFVYIPYDKLLMIGTSFEHSGCVWSLDVGDPQSTWQGMMNLPRPARSMQPVIWNSFC
jgi:hypothetical protein